jgi:tRNA 2-thiouridine synthesizing protein A
LTALGSEIAITKDANVTELEKNDNVVITQPDIFDTDYDDEPIDNDNLDNLFGSSDNDEVEEKPTNIKNAFPTAKVLDARNLKCPMPIIKISQVITQIDGEEILEVMATDPAFEGDVKAWCCKTKNEFVSFEKGANYFTAKIRRKG